MCINEGANGKSEKFNGLARALFHYHPSDRDYLRVEQFKEIQA
jgi:myo-inositol catabolism protein IolC